jgi:hypothetical protein
MTLMWFRVSCPFCYPYPRQVVLRTVVIAHKRSGEGNVVNDSKQVKAQALH